MPEDFYSYIGNKYPELKEGVVDFDLENTFLYDEYVAGMREYEAGVNSLLNRF